MSAQNNGEALFELVPASYFKATPAGHEVGLIPEDGISELANFTRSSEDGCELLMAVMSFMVAGKPYRALKIICRGNNSLPIASALSSVFHSGEAIPLRNLKAKGYDRLRDLVTTCVTDLRGNLNCPDPPENYDLLIHRLFKSRGYPAP